MVSRHSIFYSPLIAHQLECDGVGHVVASVGASMPLAAFSSLCCSREFTKTETFERFVEGYAEAREYVRAAAAEDARAEAGFFEGYSMEALEAGIRTYQSLGWREGGPIAGTAKAATVRLLHGAWRSVRKRLPGLR
jgi:ABC-type nitrate/sulfonate/bicarbonate transport system substrate-binding protein